MSVQNANKLNVCFYGNHFYYKQQWFFKNKKEEGKKQQNKAVVYKIKPEQVQRNTVTSVVGYLSSFMYLELVWCLQEINLHEESQIGSKGLSKGNVYYVGTIYHFVF